MINRVKKTIKKYNMLEKNDNVIIGLSGGSDSVTLFHVMRKIKDEIGITLSVVHVNHLIRDVSIEDENFCIELCKKYNIPIAVYKIDVKKMSKEQKITVEECGRKVRYDKFKKSFKDGAVNKIAVGHNLNDVVETFLMRLVRGSGLKGLGSIQGVRDNIIRPLIEINKIDIENFCKENKFEYKVDESNFGLDYERNRVRNKLIPLLEAEYNEGVINNINKTSKIISEENSYLEKISYEKFLSMTNRNNELTINRSKLLKEDKVIIRRIVRECIKYINKNLDSISYEHIEKVIEIASKENGKKITLPQNLIVQKTYDEIIFYKKDRDEKKEEEINLELEVVKYVDKLKRYILISKNIVEKKYIDQIEVEKTYENKIYSKENIQFTLRYRKTNDKIYFKGINGNKKLKKYFIDEKIPSKNRDKIMLLADGENIVWIFDDKNRKSDLYFNNDKGNLYITIWRKK